MITNEEMTKLKELANRYGILQTKANQAFELYAAYKFSLLKRAYDSNNEEVALIHAVDKQYKKTDEYLNIFKDPQV